MTFWIRRLIRFSSINCKGLLRKWWLIDLCFILHVLSAKRKLTLPILQVDGTVKDAKKRTLSPTGPTTSPWESATSPTISTSKFLVKTLVTRLWKCQLRSLKLCKMKKWVAACKVAILKQAWWEVEILTHSLESIWTLYRIKTTLFWWEPRLTLIQWAVIMMQIEFVTIWVKCYQQISRLKVIPC